MKRHEGKIYVIVRYFLLCVNSCAYLGCHGLASGLGIHDTVGLAVREAADVVARGRRRRPRRVIVCVDAERVVSTASLRRVSGAIHIAVGRGASEG